MQQVNHSHAIDLLLAAPKVILFIGSGVSQFTPTNLPTGAELAKNCCRTMAEQLTTAGYEYDIADLENLPLETLTGMVLEREPNKDRSGILERIANYFRTAPPNRVHWLVAGLLSARTECHVITTNYDCGIEKALRELSPKARIKSFGVNQLTSATVGDQNSIIKIHGCAVLDEPASLVLTTRQEASGLPLHLGQQLSTLFQGAVVAFLGYSLSEPDCMESLLSVADFDMLWVDLNRTRFEKNWRAQILVRQARSTYFVEDLTPFTEDLLLSRVTHHHVPHNDPPKVAKAEGLALFRELLTVAAPEKLLQAVIIGYLQLRDFEKVKLLLEQYRHMDSYSEYFWLFCRASIIRDQNSNWEFAASLFDDAAKASDASPHDQISAELEQLGLETLLASNNKKQLMALESRLLSLVGIALQHRARDTSHDREWQSVIGRLYKNLVQNVCYQFGHDTDRLSRGLDYAAEGVKHLLESQELHARTETQRFYARLLFRRYLADGDDKSLEGALSESAKAVTLFTLLGSAMGKINAKRQYAAILTNAGKLREAKREINELHELVDGSADVLSRIKLTALESYHSMRSGQRLVGARQFGKFLYESRSFTQTRTPLTNVVSALRWYLAWRRTRAG